MIRGLADHIMEETLARLKIISDRLNDKEIADLLPMQADKSWRTGETMTKTTSLMHKNSGCIISSLLPKSAVAQEHHIALLERLKPHASTIKALSAEFTVEVSVVIYTSVRPALHFPKETMQQIHDLGASFDIDLYWIPEDDDDKEST